MTNLSTSSQEIVFIDSRVKDTASLLQDFAPGVQVVYLDPQQDGLAQIAAALGVGGNYSAVHLLAHGSSGQLWLGTTFVDNSTLVAQAEVLEGIGRGLTEDGDLLIYACDTARGEEGAAFVHNLAAATGADVAASDNRTGATGDWELEVSTGSVEAAGLFMQAPDYAQDLALITVTSNADAGAGSLRNAIASAQSGDKVTFSTGMTVGLTTGQLTLNKNLTIDGDLNNDGVADVALDAQYKSRVLEVTAGSTVLLDGLVITRGLLAGNGGNTGDAAFDAQGAGIFNAGRLTLHNTSVTANAATGGGASGYGGGGGGGALGGGKGGNGGALYGGTMPGTPGSANQGGKGAGMAGVAGNGGTATGGAGGFESGSRGGSGGTANNGTSGVGGAVDLEVIFSPLLTVAQGPLLSVVFSIQVRASSR